MDPEAKRKPLRSLAVIALFSLPSLVHMVHLYTLCGNPFAYFNMQDAWGNPSPYPLESLVEFIRKGFKNPFCDWLHLFFWSLFGACLIRNYKKIPLNEILFCLGVFLISTGSNKFFGASRYVLMLIPLYVVLESEEIWFRNFYIYSNLIIGTLYIVAFTNYSGLAL
jgi:hypothetical protein